LWSYQSIAVDQLVHPGVIVEETSRVLTEAAIMRKRDSVHCLKESVIVGRLILGGIGLAFLRIEKG
jgi:hypothetical protein